MDTWGTELYSDDMACDVKEYYMNCLRENMSSDEAEASVAKYFSEELDDRKDGPIVVLALAETAWCNGRLSESLKKAAIGVLDTEEGQERWKTEGSEPNKQSVLSKLREKLMSPQPPERIIQ